MEPIKLLSINGKRVIYTHKPHMLSEFDMVNTDKTEDEKKEVDEIISTLYK